MMPGARAVLLGLLVFLFDVGCCGDAIKGTPNGLLMGAGENETVNDLLKQTVLPGVVNGKDAKSNKDLEGEVHGGIKKNPEEKNGEKSLDEGEVKPIKETKGKEKKGDNEERSTAKIVPKEKARGEECDTSNRCYDEKSKLIACFRVPGNDSPSLSLLIQNKGSMPLTVNISAPDLVKLERNTVSLPPEKDDEVVKVSVGYGVHDIPITLAAGSWHCNLSFWEMLPDSMKKSVPLSDTVRANLSKTTLVYMVILLVVIIGAAYFGIKWLRARPHEGPNYQKIDVALPVSTGGVKETDLYEGWDNSWGDNWDDEEAPMTPSNPAFNLSSKGLASRRSNKEGWRD